MGSPAATGGIPGSVDSRIVTLLRSLLRIARSNHREVAMSRNLFPLSLTATLMAGTAMAEVPRVAVDIAPVHSLVARVMEGVGEPSLIVQPGASPHEYNLRPSEAAALQDAGVVFWVGEDLTPWMAGAVET